MPGNSSSVRKPRRRRAIVIVSAAAGAAALSLASAGVVNAVSANMPTRATASLSETTGKIGDAVALDLGAAEAEDVYSASIRVSYPTDILSIDPDAIDSEFDGMWSAVGIEKEDAATVDFTVTRLGTSDGLAGDLDLGSLGFVAVGAGEAQVTVESMQLIDSGLGVVEEAPARILSFTVATPPIPSPAPSGTTAPSPSPSTSTPAAPVPNVPAPGAPAPQPPVVSAGGGNFVLTGQGGTRRSTGGEVYAAPQLDANPTTDQAPEVRLSSTSVEAGGAVTIIVDGTTPSTEHRFAFVADETDLGTARSTADGYLEYLATIPATTTAGEYEIAVFANDSIVASTMIQVTEPAVAASPAPTASSTPVVEAEEPTLDATDAEQSSSASFLWPVLIGAAVLLAALAVVISLVVRARRAKGGEL